MNKEMALKMDKRVVEFLSEYGNFPAIKEVDERIKKAEDRLRNKLVKLQAGLEAEFIKALRDKGYLPSTLKEQRKFLGKILDAPFEEMKMVISDEGVKGMELGRQMTFNELVQQGFDISLTSFSKKTLKKLKEKIYQFSADTFMRIKGDFIQTLSDGYDGGLGIDDVARNLREDFKSLRDYRLKNIARTEIQSTQNEGSHQTLIDYGVRYKQWLTVGDDRVRGNGQYDEYDHIHLHGEVVKIDESFSNGMKHPGDRSGDIGDWINCRCRERPYIPKKGEVILSTPYYP